jgi:uncharacterized membrane protein
LAEPVVINPHNFDDMQYILIKWIHLLAAVAWIGTMFANFFIYLPAISRQLDPPAAGKITGNVMKRIRVLVYICISLFVLSGVFLVALHGSNVGPIRVGDPWFLYFFAKMLVFLIMVVLAVYAFEVLAPRIVRLSAKGPSLKLGRLQKRQKIVALIGFVLGILIIFVSAAL